VTGWLVGLLRRAAPRNDGVICLPNSMEYT
jgi:hypothetical protein